MSTIPEIIQELQADNGSNYKMDVLRKHKDNKLLQRILKMTYDKVDYTFGIRPSTLDDQGLRLGNQSLEWAVNCLELRFSTKDRLTGNTGRQVMGDILMALNEQDGEVFYNIINRDLRINMGRSNINKVFKGLIVKPVYMRCGLFNNDTKKKINPQGAFVQLKADGTYREFTVENGEVLCNSRSGEVYDYPVLNQTLSTYPDGHYIGELTVIQDDVLQDRATGNGLINSDNPPHDDIYLDLWDYVTLEEYTNAANKIKGTTPYYQRLQRLNEIIGDNLSPNRQHVALIETYTVSSFADAVQRCADWMTAGYEGAILKDRDAIFRDGTSPQQLKMKLEIDVDVRITGFREGTPGTKREATFGAMTFETDDGMIRGRTSGFTDAQLEDFNSRREELIGQIMTVTCNDITRGRDNDYYALSHPRFVELRSDKTETDTLERALETKEMTMSVGE